MTRLWILATGTALLIAFVSAGAYKSGLLLRRWSPTFNLLLNAPENAVRLLLIATAVGLGVVFGPGPDALGWSPRRLIADVLLGFLVALVLAPVFAVLARQMARRWGPDTYNTIVLRAVLPASRAEWALVLVALLPAAALEELIFRSLPLGGLAALVPPWWLMWPLAIMFGLLHWPQGTWGVVGTALASIVLSLLFLLTGRMWAPLAAHYLLNALQITLAQRSGHRPLPR